MELQRDREPGYHIIIIGPGDLCGQTVYFEDNTILDVTKQEAPAFRNPSLEAGFHSADDFRNYFGINSSSVALNEATNKSAPDVDREGMKRPVKIRIDAGCYEWQRGEE